MKQYPIFSLLLVLIAGEAYALRRASHPDIVQPQTRAEQFMRKYIPQPYPSHRIRATKTGIVSNGFYPYYRGASLDSESSYWGATNESEQRENK